MALPLNKTKIICTIGSANMSHDKDHQAKHHAPSKECTKDHVHDKECCGEKTPATEYHKEQNPGTGYVKGIDPGKEHEKKHSH